MLLFSSYLLSAKSYKAKRITPTCDGFGPHDRAYDKINVDPTALGLYFFNLLIDSNTIY